MISILIVSYGETIIAIGNVTLPTCINSELSIKVWVEEAVRNCPPEGGDVTMIKHWTPHHAKNDKVVEIWIVPAVVEVVMDDGNKDHEMAFVVYHVDTGKTTVDVLMGIPDDQLQKYLDADTNTKSI